MADAEKKTATIMPGTALNHEVFQMLCRAVKSHKQSCDADLYFLDNPGDNESLQAEMRKFVESLGYHYRIVDKPFSLTGFWNYGLDLVSDAYDYVVYSNADVVFYEYWLHYILEHWNQGRNRTKYFSLHPYTYSPVKRGLNFRDTTLPEHKVIDCDHPQLHLSVFRTADNYRWDEQYTRWECDCDYWMWLRQQNLMAGVVQSSRVDHIVGGINSSISAVTIDAQIGQDKERFYTKWKFQLREAEEKA